MKFLISISLLLLSTSVFSVEKLKVRITRHLESVEIQHEGKSVVIMRNQDTTNTINPSYSKTSRKCPPFCIQPLILALGVETIGERKMLDYLQRSTSGDDSILVIDSRSPKWVERGTIPGSINLPYKELLKGSQEEVADILVDMFDVERGDVLFNFRFAKTLVLFCNGLWCGQAPTNIKTLLKLGYPSEKLKYYRGGMQAWESLGLTTVIPKEE